MKNAKTQQTPRIPKRKAFRSNFKGDSLKQNKTKRSASQNEARLMSKTKQKRGSEMV